jgi:hypothetical protein
MCLESCENALIMRVSVQANICESQCYAGTTIPSHADDLRIFVTIVTVAEVAFGSFGWRVDWIGRDSFPAFTIFTTFTAFQIFVDVQGNGIWLA